MAIKLVKVLTYNEGLPPIKPHDPLIILVRSRDKPRTYLHHQSVYGHQPWQDNKLPLWASFHKVTWSSEITRQTKTILSPLPQRL